MSITLEHLQSVLEFFHRHQKDHTRQQISIYLKQEGQEPVEQRDRFIPVIDKLYRDGYIVRYNNGTELIDENTPFIISLEGGQFYEKGGYLEQQRREQAEK